jgi:Bacterial Ig-like domain
MRIAMHLLRGILGPCVLALMGGACGSEAVVLEPPADSVAPFITAIAPAPGTTEVSLGTIITVSFSEAINTATVGPASFALLQGNALVAGAYRFEELSAAFVPDAPLVPGTTYSAMVTRGIRDPAGNQLPRDTTWTFVTAPVSAAPR